MATQVFSTVSEAPSITVESGLFTFRFGDVSVIMPYVAATDMFDSYVYAIAGEAKRLGLRGD